MTDDQKAAYVIAMAACAQVEAIGMLSENQRVIALGHRIPPYNQADFEALIEKHGIHHNAVLTLFHGS